MEKAKSKTSYHIIAAALLIFGFVYTQVYMPTVNEITAINEVALATKELWYVGMAIFVEILALVNK